MSTSAISDIKAMLAEIRSSLSIIEDRLVFAPAADLREAELRLRRVRDSVFPPGYFGDPAWDTTQHFATCLELLGLGPHKCGP